MPLWVDNKGEATPIILWWIAVSRIMMKMTYRIKKIIIIFWVDWTVPEKTIANPYLGDSKASTKKPRIPRATWEVLWEEIMKLFRKENKIEFEKGKNPKKKKMYKKIKINN